MAHSRWFSLSLALLVAGGVAAGAQSATTAAPCTTGASSMVLNSGSSASRLSGDWRSSAPVVLAASQGGRLQNATALGIAPAGTRLERMLLLLEPSPAQRQALDAELEAQQTPGNCEYHRWLSAQQFADRFA